MNPDPALTMLWNVFMSTEFDKFTERLIDLGRDNDAARVDQIRAEMRQLAFKRGD